MDSMQVGKAVFGKESYTTLGIEPRTYSIPGRSGNHLVYSWVKKTCGQGKKGVMILGRIPHLRITFEEKGATNLSNVIFHISFLNLTSICFDPSTIMSTLHSNYDNYDTGIHQNSSTYNRLNMKRHRCVLLPRSYTNCQVRHPVT